MDFQPLTWAKKNCEVTSNHSLTSKLNLKGHVVPQNYIQGSQFWTQDSKDYIVGMQQVRRLFPRKSTFEYNSEFFFNKALVLRIQNVIIKNYLECMKRSVCHTF